MATFNCRSLSNESRLAELEQELSKIKWDIIGLSEVRRKDENYFDLRSKNIFYYKGNQKGQNGGVDFLIHQRLRNNIVEFEGISDRVARVVIKLNERYNLQIIQVYAPTTSHTDEEVEDF